MKKWIISALCLTLCMALGCSVLRVPKEETQVTEQPAAEATAKPEPVPTEAAATEAPENDPEKRDSSGDIELPEIGTDVPVHADLQFDGVTLFGDAIDSGIIKDYDLVIVNFWAEWCGPCVGEMPALERIHQDYPNVLILGVWIGDDANGAKGVLSDLGVTYPIPTVSGTLEAYATKSMYIPATYFFDADGVEIGEPVIGSQDYTEWKTVIESLLP